MKIKIFTTGGSIDKGYSTLHSDFIVLEPSVSGILQDAYVNLEFDIVPLFRKDSLEITPEDRQQIVQAVKSAPERHIIITHGTDTMTMTGQALKGITDKVIVLTGAMQPSAFKHTDATFNVGSAVAAVQILPTGVFIAMSGLILDVDQARKNAETNQFESV